MVRTVDGVGGTGGQDAVGGRLEEGRGHRKHGRAGIAALAAASAASLAGVMAGPAVAAAGGAQAAIVRPAAAVALPRVWVMSRATGIVLSTSTLHAGRTTLIFSTNRKEGSDALLLRLNSGATLTKVIRALQAEGGKPAAAAQATRTLTRIARYYGGGVLSTPNQHVTVTQTLTAGTYYFLDVGAIFAGKWPTYPAFRVTGMPPVRRAPGYTATVNMTSSDRFVVSGMIRHDSGIRVRNVADTLHFMQMQPVKPGTTDQTMTQVFAGKIPPTSVMAGPPVAVDVQSPGRQVIATATLQPGLYDLECFVADEHTGLPHAFMGMHKIVQVS